MDKDNLFVDKRMKSEILNFWLTFFIFVFGILISIAYSAINVSLTVSGDLEYEAGEELYSIISKASKGLDTNIDFSVAPTEATSGVYKMNSTRNDRYPVYYYRGIVNSNNLNFAGFCWKIVRTTSTGGVKLLYNGVQSSSGNCNNIVSSRDIGSSSFNLYSYDSDGKYVGYTYDNTDSEVKKVIDKWYKNNMASYTKMLEDTEWCNDRSVYKFTEYITHYGAHGRNYLAPYEPSVICPNVSDKYTVSSTIGNGKLTYPIGLLTADEATLAGQGVRGYIENGYLSMNTTFWLMSPSMTNSGNTFVYDVYKQLDHEFTHVTKDVRPAVSLVAGTIISEGDGTASKPFKIIGK